MWCPQCGRSNKDSARFCDQCGLDFAGYREQWQTGGAQTAAQQSSDQAPHQPPYQQQYQSPYQQQYAAPQYRPISSFVPPPRVPSYLGWAVAVLILCFWPTAIPAVVYASQVGDKLAVGDIAGAQESSRKAKKWCWISFGIAAAGVVLVIVVVAILFAVAASSSGVVY